MGLIPVELRKQGIEVKKNCLKPLSETNIRYGAVGLCQWFTGVSNSEIIDKLYKCFARIFLKNRQKEGTVRFISDATVSADFVCEILF